MLARGHLVSHMIKYSTQAREWSARMHKANKSGGVPCCNVLMAVMAVHVGNLQTGFENSCFNDHIIFYYYLWVKC